MPLRLVVGPANAAKAGAVLGAYRARLRDEALLVVPTRADVAFYEHELAAQGTLVGGAVVSFGGLVREIARRTGYSARVVRRLGRERLVAEAVAGTRLRALRRSAEGPGFVAAAAELLAELARARVGPERLAEALAGWAGSGRDRRAHAEELVELARRYEAALDRAGRVDEDASAWRAVDALRRGPGAWGAAPVFLYGFDDLTAVQRDAVRALASEAGAEVTVSLPYEPRAAFAGRASTVEDLRPGADVVALAASEDFYAPGAAATLHHLERHLFEDDAPRVAPGPAVRLLEAGGERAEAELVAAAVAGFVAEGVPADEVAVVARGGSRTAALLAAALGALGLPVAGERTVPAGHTTLGRGLVGLLRAALSRDASADDLLAWLRTPGRLRRPELADRLELECRRRGVRDAARAGELWEELQPGFRLGELDRLRGSGEGLLETVREQAVGLFSAPFAGRAPVLEAAEAEDARVLAALLDALAELAELGGAGRPAELPDLVAGVPVRLGDPARPGAVTLADPLGIRARRFRVVAVCGLQAGSFPRPPRPEPFLPEEARGALAQIGLRVALERDTAAEERYLFYACASRPTEALLLSRRTSDEEGNPEPRSPFLEDVERLFDGPLDRVERPLAEVTWPAALAPTPREAARAAAAAGPREPLPGLGDLHSPEVRALARHTAVLSAGALEAYAGCPVRWFVDRELAPEVLEPEPEAFARGGFVHELLERTLTELRASTGSARVTPDTVAEAERILASAIAEGRAALEDELPEVTARATIRGIEADLRRYLEHAAATGETPFEPAHFELRFGMDDDPDALPALVVGEGEDAVRIRGAIDRVDVGADGRAIVRDYKSGVARDAMYVNNWERRSTLQVALYMLAVRQLLGLDPIAGVYQPLRGRGPGDLRARGLLVAEDPALEPLVGRAFVDRDERAPDEFAAALDGAAERTVELARDLRAGRLHPRPETCAFFGGCAFPGICRSGT